jgi:GNAT superfamily N-acetyltransferase
MKMEIFAGGAPAPGIIRDLRADENAQFRKHLQRLDAISLRDRFNGGVGPEFIAKYAARTFTRGIVVAGYFESGVLRGAAELHPVGRDERNLPVAEIAFSVEKDWQRRGIGTRLFRRLIRDARGRGIEILYVSTHTDNHAMRALALRFRAELTFKAGEGFGTVDIGPVPDDLLYDGPINRDADFAA